MPKIVISANIASQRKSVATKIMDCLAKMGFKNSRKIIGASYDSKDNYSVVLIFFIHILSSGRRPIPIVRGRSASGGTEATCTDVHEPNVVVVVDC